MSNQPNEGAITGAYPFHGNKFVQFGSLAFTTTSDTIAVRTNLTNIEVGLASYDDTVALLTGTDAACNSMLAVEKVVASNAFLVVRSTQDAAKHSAATFSFIVIGNVDATD